MAEIKIEQKKQIWPWLLGVIIVLALLVYLMTFRDDTKNTEEVMVADSINNTNDYELLEVKENKGAVLAYINFIKNDTGKMSLDHEYTVEALLYLAEASDEMASSLGFEIKEEIEKVRNYSKMITKDPFVTTHADNIIKAEEIINSVLLNIQKTKFPSLGAESSELKSALKAIKPGILTLDQKEAVKNYFSKAADLLQKMNDLNLKN